MNHKKTGLFLIASVALVAASPAASIVWNAASDAGVAMPNGSMVTIGNLVRLGWFDVSDTAIQQNALNLTYLDSHFHQLDFDRIGGPEVNNSPGYWAESADVDTRPSVSAVAGMQMMLWAFASSNNTSLAQSLATATHQGIFYFDKTQNNRWATPGDPESGLPSQTSIDLGDLSGQGASNSMLLSGARVLVGSFPTPSGGALNAPNFALAAVPEPSVALMAILGGVTLLQRRRRVT